MPDASDYISRKNSDALVAGAVSSNINKRAIQASQRALLKRVTGPRGYVDPSLQSNTQICFGAYTPSTVTGCLSLSGFTGLLNTNGTFTLSDGSSDTTIPAVDVFPVSTNEISSIGDPVIIYNCTDKAYSGTSIAGCNISIDPKQFHILVADKVTLLESQPLGNICVTTYNICSNTLITDQIDGGRLNADLSFSYNANGDPYSVSPDNVFPASTDVITTIDRGIIYNCTETTYIGTTSIGDVITIANGEFYILSSDSVELEIQI
jgi:hypothetical protein